METQTIIMGDISEEGDRNSRMVADVLFHQEDSQLNVTRMLAWALKRAHSRCKMIWN